MFKVEKTFEGDSTVLRLVGRVKAEHLPELKTLIAGLQAPVQLDLTEVTLVDVDVVCFLGDCERRGIQLVNCLPYVREWIQREKAANSVQPEQNIQVNPQEVNKEDDMATKLIPVERFSITSAKPFSDVVGAIRAQVGHPDITKFFSDISAAKDDQELQKIVIDAVGPTDLMEFMRFDQGAVLRRELGPAAPNVLRLLIGNPLTMRKMVKHVHDAGSYAPVTILIAEKPDGVHISYDRMASLIAPYDNSDALRVAKALDNKIEYLLIAAAQ